MGDDKLKSSRRTRTKDIQRAAAGTGTVESSMVMSAAAGLKDIESKLNLLNMRISSVSSKINLYRNRNLTITPDILRQFSIIDKGGVSRPFEVWEHQKKPLNDLNHQLSIGKPVRQIDCKPRQCGNTRLWETIAYYYATRYALRFTMMGHNDKWVDQRYNDIHATMMKDPFVVPELVRARYGEGFEFPGGGGISLYTAGGKNQATGSTQQGLILSELPYWECDVIGQLKSVLETVSSTHALTFIIIESTGEPETVFEQYWKDAVYGKNGFSPIFTSWLEVAEYRKPFYSQVEKDEFVRIMDKDAHYLVEDCGADLEQVKWKRDKVASIPVPVGDNNELRRLVFNSEYPLIWENAFELNTVGIFPTSELNILKANAGGGTRCEIDLGPYYFNSEEESALDYGDIVANKKNIELAFRPSIWGRCTVWKYPDWSLQYVTGVDVAEGEEGGKTDNHAIIVREQESGDVVLAWEGGGYDADQLADLVAAIGFLYNESYTLIERNNYGMATCLRFYDIYPKHAIYFEKSGPDRDERNRVGVFTSDALKPLYLTHLATSIRNKMCNVRDRQVINEMAACKIGKTRRVHTHGKDLLMALVLTEEARIDRPSYSLPKPVRESSNKEKNRKLEELIKFNARAANKYNKAMRLIGSQKYA